MSAIMTTASMRPQINQYEIAKEFTFARQLGGRAAICQRRWYRECY